MGLVLAFPTCQNLSSVSVNLNKIRLLTDSSRVESNYLKNNEIQKSFDNRTGGLHCLARA